jgi:hypothetical protein
MGNNKKKRNNKKKQNTSNAAVQSEESVTIEIENVAQETVEESVKIEPITEKPSTLAEVSNIESPCAEKTVNDCPHVEQKCEIVSEKNSKEKDQSISAPVENSEKMTKCNKKKENECEVK